MSLAFQSGSNNWTELKRWLAGGSALWMVLAFLAAVYIAVAMFPAVRLFPEAFDRGCVEFADRVRWCGILLEALAIGLIAFGLMKASAAFDKPLFRRALRWLIDVRYVVVRRPAVNMNAAGQSLGVSIGVGIVTTKIAGDGIEQQIEALRQSLNTLEQRVGGIDKKVSQVEENLTAKLNEETKHRTAADEDITQAIENHKIGDIHLQVAGLVLLLVSVVLANAPVESSYLLNRAGLALTSFSCPTKAGKVGIITDTHRIIR